MNGFQIGQALGRIEQRLETLQAALEHQPASRERFNERFQAVLAILILAVVASGGKVPEAAVSWVFGVR